MKPINAAWTILFGATACTTELPQRLVADAAIEVAALPGSDTEHALMGPPVEFPVEFVVTARGEAAGGIDPLMALAVDGREIGRTSVGDETIGYVFRVDPDEIPGKPIVEVDVRYLNDAGAGSGATREDRNLFVSSLSVNGREIPARAPQVRYYRVAGDVRETIPGRTAMFWGGALIFPVSSDMLATGDDTDEGAAGG